ncbi:hypothetical protein EBU71_20865, partial [bacterium]|nr:hypothetical protein [Candidatus Elulimicrobium humile]
MAYKYFTQKLLSSDLNLADVFPEQQDDARVQVNASYSLFDIAQFLQDRTDNFNKTEQQYIDLDSAISEIISKWYKSTGKEKYAVKIKATIDKQPVLFISVIDYLEVLFCDSSISYFISSTEYRTSSMVY